MVNESDIYQHYSQEGLKDPRHKKTYEKVFQELERQPDYSLPAGFAKSVIQKIDLAEQKRKKLFYFGMGSGVFVMVTTFVVVMLIGYGWEQISQYQNFVYWAVFVGVVVAFVQYLDRKLVSRKSTSQLV